MTQAEYARHRNKSPRYIGKPYKTANCQEIAKHTGLRPEDL